MQSHRDWDKDQNRGSAYRALAKCAWLPPRFCLSRSPRPFCRGS
ncbi:Uncharacterised protein [Vibrio cholerae]|nr:Uncharacterised protein [Vibrio cholerae]